MKLANPTNLSTKLSTNPGKLKKRAKRMNVSGVSKKACKLSDVERPFVAFPADSKKGIVLGFHGVSVHLHSFLDLPSLVGLFGTCKGGRWRQSSNWSWRPLLIGHGLTVDAKLVASIPARRLLKRAPTVAPRAVFTGIKKAMFATGGNLGFYACMKPVRLNGKIANQIGTITVEEAKIAELERKLHTAKDRHKWMVASRKEMEAAVPLCTLNAHVKKATKHLTKVVKSRAKPRKLKAKAAVPSPLMTDNLVSAPSVVDLDMNAEFAAMLNIGPDNLIDLTL